MKKIILICLMFVLPIISQPKGHLLIIGGGDRPAYMMNKYIELAGGKNAKIVIIPNASTIPKEEAYDHGSELKKLGCTNINVLWFTKETADSKENLAQMEGVTGVFFSGGDQTFLTRDMLGSKLLAKIKDIYNKGGIVGGTSAGAAVMSKVMITGNQLAISDTNNNFYTVTAKNVETIEGFGFLTDVIIDQHFIVRKRENRLICATLENNLPGIGIDESTAILVEKGRYFTVVGESGVIIINPKTGKRLKNSSNGLVSGRDITLHLLMNGDRYDMKTNKILTK
jgi:cyanophycinase